ncbi:hypothetical protein T03_9560, partial [Trichinella britovi]
LNSAFLLFILYRGIVRSSNGHKPVFSAALCK